MADRSGNLGMLGLAIAGAIAVPIIFGNAYVTWNRSAELRSARDVEILAPAPRPRPPAAPVAPEPPEEPERPLWPREVDGAVLGQIEFRGSGDALDVAPDRPYRIDVTRTAEGRLIGARVDLDRDGKIDERWTFDDGVVLRESSPKDDGRYTKHHRYDDGTWVEVEPPGGG